jgi:hypothetical protein
MVGTVGSPLASTQNLTDGSLFVLSSQGARPALVNRPFRLCSPLRFPACGKAMCRAGAGIVADSNPEFEQEVNKAKALFHAISVFVSRKLSGLFVRQGFTPLFDVPVKIQNPEQPLGTHVFTAMDYQNAGASIPGPSCHFSRTKKREAVATPPLVMLPDKASDALDRIEIPREAIEQISQLLTPGSSLIISDYGISHETGNNTDFIVVMHLGGD